MKSYHEPIDVTLGDDGTPQSWRWRQSVWRVLRVLDRWILQARWWNSTATGSQGEKRGYLLVEAAPESSDSDDLCVAVEIYWRVINSEPSMPTRTRAGGLTNSDGDACGVVTDAWILARILH